MFTTESKRNFTPADPSSRIIWIDLELTDLDLEKSRILEIVSIVTDANLNVVAESSDYVIHEPQEVLDSMNEWCLKTHRKTGLYEDVLKSTLTLKEAEERTLEFLRQHTEPKTCPLAGNCVFMDRLFLAKHTPTLEQYLHPQIFDVSSLKEMCMHWRPDIMEKAPKKTLTHRARSDLHESIAELKFYRSVLLDKVTNNVVTDT